MNLEEALGVPRDRLEEASAGHSRNLAAVAARHSREDLQSREDRPEGTYLQRRDVNGGLSFQCSQGRGANLGHQTCPEEAMEGERIRVGALSHLGGVGG